MTKPSLCDDGNVLFVSLMPPDPGGSSIVTRNLLDQFRPDSIVVATTGKRGRTAMRYESDVDVREILRSFPHSRRINNWMFRLQVPAATRKLIGLAREVNARVLIATHPSVYLMGIARDAARRLEIPWIAYLHDTLAEAAQHLRTRNSVSALQDAVFREASHVLVMSEGMSALYESKYNGLTTTPLEHIYPLTVRAELPGPPARRAAFWAGNVYDVNARSFARVAQAVRSIGTTIHMSSAKDLSVISDLQVDTHAIERAYYPEWGDYIRVLNDHEVLILALDWPDESPVHRDELATIFPTKTPEYLASGRPILVHCPADYFLARFFRERECGTIVPERSIEALADTLRRVRQNDAEIQRRTTNALKATSVFSPDRIARRLKAVVDATAKVSWGKRVAVDLQA